MIKLRTIDGEEKTLTFYTSVKEMPIKRYQLTQKYTLIDAGVGSTYHDVLRHFSRFEDFIIAGDMESVAIERDNLIMNMNFIMSDNWIKTYTFCTFIKTIDGKLVDINDDNIDELVEMVECSDIVVSTVEELVETQKKSLITS